MDKKPEEKTTEAELETVLTFDLSNDRKGSHESLHDMGYKMLLSKKMNFLKFMEFYGTPPNVDFNPKDISEENLELVPSEFIKPTTGKRSADVIWKVTSEKLVEDKEAMALWAAETRRELEAKAAKTA
jgi:hypothetical protein